MSGSKEKEDKWQARFLALSEHISHWTEDRDVNVGAVIVGPDREIRSTGFNGLPRGVLATDDSRFNRATGEKFHWFEHAERNAIYNAARNGVAVNDCIIFINRFPCADCARAIIQTGISEVHCPSIPAFDGALDESFAAAHVMLKEAGVNVVLHGEGLSL